MFGIGVVGKYGVPEPDLSPSSRGSDGTESHQEATVAPESADYYVATDGDDDGPGTEERPFATLGAAVAEVSPGETVVLRGGVYSREESVRVADLAGTAEERITIAGHPGERPVFQFDGPTPGGWDYSGPDGGGLKFDGVEYLTVANLAVRDSPYLGVEVSSGASHNVFENVETYNNNLVGFGLYNGCTDNELRNIVSMDNYDPQNGGGDADGIQIESSSDNRVVGARLFHNSDDGLDLWNSRSIVVENSMSWDNGRGEHGNGNGFKLGGGSDADSGGHEVYRNVAFNNDLMGFNYNEADIPIEVFNNTAWNNERNFVFHDASHQIRNNISYEGDVTLGDSVEHDHNSWNEDIEQPGFVSMNPLDDRFLRLQRESPCIGRGVDVGLDYEGESPDLGAFEFRRD